MERRQSSLLSKQDLEKPPESNTEDSINSTGDYQLSERSSSHTKFLKKKRHSPSYERITRDEYFGISESISGSSATYGCDHGPQGKKYSEKGLLKRNLLKELDPIPLDPNWNDKCPPAYDWDIAKKLEFLVLDPTVEEQMERLLAHLRDFIRTSKAGFRVQVLDSLSTVLHYLMDSSSKNSELQECLPLLLANMDKPILLKASSDIVTCFESLRNYIGFLGYLLMTLESDSDFDLASRGLIWQLSAPDSLRGHGTARLCHTLAAAVPLLYQPIVRMLPVTSSYRFPTFLQISLLLACDSAENCLRLMKENIIENIFYRFNPYFPARKLPIYDINPADPNDYNVQLGDSSVNMSTTLSLLLVLLKTAEQYVRENPDQKHLLPCPDSYAQRCFIWAYRFECRAREHRHQRTTLAVVALVLLNCFKEQLTMFSTILMPDVLSLAVQTELPLRDDWTQTVIFSTGQSDVQFKKILITFSVALLKVFPHNKFMIEHHHWLLGLMYLLDPGLCHLKARWSQSLFAELRKTALQALICALPLIPPRLAIEYGIIRRIMWYIEWYSESPYELHILYWCVRLLCVALYHRQVDRKARNILLRDLFDSHGVIIIIHLCYTLLDQKLPPVEKSQVIISICLRMLTSAIEAERRIVCSVYPSIKWPASINSVARRMLDTAVYALDKHYVISDRWLISLLNFIWETIIWKLEYREIFVGNDGIYKLLDIITMTRVPVQCITLAMICDVVRAGEAVGQLVTWRANFGASNAYPNLVKRGATIASLLAAIFRDECSKTGIRLDEYGIIQDMDFPLMKPEIRKMITDSDFSEGKSERTSVCIAASDMAGSRLSKAYALLQMLSEDLQYGVALADEAYNLYKNVKLAPEDETILVLCSHYLTLKLIEAWNEINLQSPELLDQDAQTLKEFLEIGKGWAKEIHRQQNEVISGAYKKECEEECSLYSFLARVRLNIALDALRGVRCVARSADRAIMTHALIQDAVKAHHRRSVISKSLDEPVLRTYGPLIDDQNITGQHVKVNSNHPKRFDHNVSSN